MLRTSPSLGFLTAARTASHEIVNDQANGPRALRDATDRMCAIHIRPEHWLTRDYTKAGG